MSDKEDIWNFSFGSNMGSVSLTKRRKIYPKESLPAVLKGYQLSFNFRALPFFDPASGTIEKSDSDVVCHGVVHRMTRVDFERLKYSEFVSGNKDIDTYFIEEVTVETYDGKSLKALVFITSHLKPNSAHSMSLCSPYGLKYPTCTNRYLNLLQQGARENKLDVRYTEFLDSLPHYTPTILARIIMVVLCLTYGVIVVVLPCLMLMIRYKLEQIKGLQIFHRLVQHFLRVCWFIFDLFPLTWLGRNDRDSWIAFTKNAAVGAENHLVKDSQGRRLCKYL